MKGPTPRYSALALAKAPDLARRVRRIVLMGGAVAGGNVTPVAEYNIHADPEAADIVFRSGAPITTGPPPAAMAMYCRPLTE